ncbi:GNAT family N-acetyltransferase [Candidatus Pelagibacter sp.]|nr:GNAT family N-acetyltransferase [Candidatus Pelagibacter sp.]
MYKIFSTKNKKEWQEYMSICKKKDLFFSIDYFNLFEKSGHGNGNLFVYEKKNNYFLFPYLINSLKTYGFMDHSKYYDIQTPYGYGGFITNTNSEEFIIESLDNFNSFAKKNNIIASFIRFNPFISANTNNSPILKTLFNREILYVDLKLGLKTIYKKVYSSNQRNMIRKARKHFIITHSTNKENYKNFIKLYIQNMKRINAKKFYFFDKTFFNELFKNLKDNLVIFTASKKTNPNKPVSAILVLFDNNYSYYFLAGKSEKKDDNSSTNILIHKALIFLKNKKIDIFNLGGGNSIKNDDPLFKFKKSISKSSIPFYIGTMIHNQKIYNEVSDIWSKKYPNLKISQKFLKYQFDE